MSYLRNYCRMVLNALWLLLYSRGKVITCNYKFPVFRNGVYISWESKSKSVINDKGELQYQNVTADHGKINLIATLSVHKSYFSDEEQKWRIKLPLSFRYQLYSIEQRIRLSYEELTYSKVLGANRDRFHVISDLTLMKKSSYGIAVKWYSDNEDSLTKGRINRGNEDKHVTLTAQLNCRGIYAEKQFEILIKASEQTGKKLLIMVPHGDDEIFMAYSVIRKAVLHHLRVYVCFFCNNDAKGTHYTMERHKEALRALGYLGVEKKRIFCLGYSARWEKRHIYNVSNTILTSINGSIHTYGSGHIKDWRTLKTGRPAEYTRENIVIDICDVINSIRPDIIFANDFDKHPDHTAYSLLFEEAMGICLKKNNGYRPAVYKGFVYCTGAYSKPAFFKCRLPYTKKPSKKSAYYPIQYESELENPSLCWKDRVRFQTDKELLNRNIHRNPAIRALIMYQRMYRNIPCFIKRDSVFWQRRTDNLMLGARITASSGHAEFLNDFKLTDVNKLNVAPYKFDAGEWIPNETDKDKEIQIVFSEVLHIGRIRFYRNRGEMYVKKIMLTYSGNSMVCELFRNDIPYQDIKIDIQTAKLNIKVLDRLGKRVGFTEIEAYYE